MTDYSSIFSAAVDLPVQERRRLIDELTATVLDNPPPLSAAWKSEIERRGEEIRSGAVKMVPWEEVERRLEEIIGHPDDSRNAS